MANIGKSISIKGDLPGDEDIQVEGTVEGQIRVARDLRVAVKAIHKAGLRPASLADYIPDTNGKVA